MVRWVNECGSRNQRKPTFGATIRNVLKRCETVWRYWTIMSCCFATICNNMGRYDEVGYYTAELVNAFYAPELGG